MNRLFFAAASLGMWLGLLGSIPPLIGAPIDWEPNDAPVKADGEAAEELAKAVAAFRQGDIDTTLNYLERAAKVDPNLAPAEVMLANMHFSEDQAARGRQVLERANTLHPQDPEPHLIFGDLAWRERRLSDAHLQYEQGGRLTAQFTGSQQRKQQLKVRALAGLAHVAEARGQLAKAEEWLTALLSLDSNHAQARFRLGNVLYALGRPQKALAELRKVARLSDDSPPPALTLARLYLQDGEYEHARTWIEKSIEEAPTNVETWLAMAKWQLTVPNDPAAASQYLARAVELVPDSSQVRLLRGLVAWSQEQLAEAEAVLEPLALSEPGNALANTYLAAVIAEQQDDRRRHRAMELIQLAANQNPRNAEVLATLGWVYFQAGKLDKAQQILQQLSSAGNMRRDSAYYLARTLFRRGQVAQAQEVLQKALSAHGMFIHGRAAQRWQQELGRPGKQ